MSISMLFYHIVEPKTIHQVHIVVLKCYDNLLDLLIPSRLVYLLKRKRNYFFFLFLKIGLP